MYIRSLHYQLMDSCPAYQVAAQPVLWFGKQVSAVLPESLRTLIDRIVYAFEIIIPKMSIVIGGAAVTYFSGSPQAAWAMIGALIWFIHDVADSLQFYPYDFLEDMSGASFQEEKESIVVRQDLVDRIVFYLTKPQANNNNVLAVGPAGSGKTATALALVRFIQSDHCPLELKNMKVYRVRLDKLMANVQRPGDFEMRFLTLLSAAKFDKDAILFIDEAHQLLDNRGNGNTSLANLLKPFLSSGMRCMAATTKKEYEQRIVHDEGFEQRFNLVEMPALSTATCIRILQKKFPGLSSNAARTAMEEAQSLNPHKALPRSAIILLENTQHAKKMTPTEDAILEQIKFERDSLGTLSSSNASVA